MSVARKKEAAQAAPKPPKQEPSPALKAQLEASVARENRDVARAEDDPSQEEFWRALRAIGTALCHHALKVDEPHEATLIDWCGRQVTEKALTARDAFGVGGRP